MIVGLVVLGFALPYLTMQYQDYSSAVVQSTERLPGAAALVGGFDPTYFPTYEPSERDQLNLALNVIAAGPSIHLSGYALVVVPLPLFLGLSMLRSGDVSISVGPGWVPGVLLGITVLAVSFPARKRLDTYGGV